MEASNLHRAKQHLCLLTVHSSSVGFVENESQAFVISAATHPQSNVHVRPGELDVFIFRASLLCLLPPCSYVWEHLEMGYVQGMCDLLAPLMVILDDGETPRLELFDPHRCHLQWQRHN